MGMLSMTMVVATISGCGSTKETVDTAVEESAETTDAATDEQSTDTAEAETDQGTDIAEKAETESTDTTNVTTEESVENEYKNLVYDDETHEFVFSSPDKNNGSVEFYTDDTNSFSLSVYYLTTKLDNFTTLQDFATKQTEDLENSYNNMSDDFKRISGLTTLEVVTIEGLDFLKITNTREEYPVQITYVYPLLVNGSYIDKTGSDGENRIHVVQPYNAGNATEGDYNIFNVGLTEKGLVEAINLLY